MPVKCIKNVSGDDIFLTDFGHQRVAAGGAVELLDEETRIGLSTQIPGLLASGTITLTTERFWKKSITDSNTTDTNWQRKMRMNMDITASGTYRLGWTANINSSANAQEVACRVQLDDETPNLDKQQSKGKDVVSIGGFHYKVLATGTHTLDLDWKAVSGGTATINKARLEYWRELSEMEEI